MRICVPGNSASAGTGLPDRQNAWPWLVAAELGALLGEDVEVTHFTLFPVGPRAAPYALRKIDECAPDIVVVPLGTYACAIRTVEEGMRRRFGERAARFYKRVERAFERRTSSRRESQARLNRTGRTLARRLLGTAPVATVEEVVAVNVELLRGLSQREGIHVMVLAEPHWPDWIAQANRGSMEAWEAVLDGVRPVAVGHRFLWLESDPGFGAAPDRESLYQPDGVHKTELGYRIQADLVLGALVGPGGPFEERLDSERGAVRR